MKITAINFKVNNISCNLARLDACINKECHQRPFGDVSFNGQPTTSGSIKSVLLQRNEYIEYKINVIADLK